MTPVSTVAASGDTNPSDATDSATFTSFLLLLILIFY